jgi:hypothetical protein
MASIYDALADSCAALAAKTKRRSDKVRMLQLADQWRTVPTDRQGPGKKPPAPAAPANGSARLSCPVREGLVCAPKSATDEINKRKGQLETNANQAKQAALHRAREAVGVLRELGIDDDTILTNLSFRAERKPQRRRG